jgi:hypothetical protein
MTKRARTAIAFVIGLGWLAALATAAGAEVFVYPKPGSTQEQLQRDQYECHGWAKTQTGFDPAQPAVVAASPPTSGGAVRGGARGAAVGAIGGAIGGNAGKGAAIGAGVGAATGLIRQGSHNRESAEAAAMAQNQQQANMERYERSFAACMAGRGYQVR